MDIKLDSFNRAKEIAEKVVDENGCYLIDFKTFKKGKRTFIKVIAETESGISIDQITAITKQLKNVEEFNEFYPSGYNMEVTSPGLDYHLKNERDFRRNIGRRINLRHSMNNIPSPIEGKLIDVGTDSIKMEIDSNVIKIELSDMMYAKVILEW